MKFKKLLAITCSFLLATTSFLCGGFASARYHNGKLSVIVMINSGEELQDGICDGEPEDKVYYNSFKRALFDHRGFSVNTSPDACYFFSYLNKCCPSIEESMLWMTMCNVPDFFVITANLAKTEDQIKADLNKHFEQILHCQKNAVLFMSKGFPKHADVPFKEIYLNTVPVVICGTSSRNTPQITSHDKFTEIAKNIRAERQGEGENKFKYICDKVCVTGGSKPYVFINMGNMARTEKDFDEFCHETIVKDDIKPTIWKSYRNTEFPSRVAKEEGKVLKCISSESVRLDNLAKSKSSDAKSLNDQSHRMRNQSEYLTRECADLRTIAASQREKEESEKTGKRQRKEVDSEKSEAPKPKKSKK